MGVIPRPYRHISIISSLLVITGTLWFTACATIPPRNITNSCAIFYDKGNWYGHATSSYKKWGVPISGSVKVRFWLTTSVCHFPFALLEYLTFLMRIVSPESCLFVTLNLMFLQISPATAVSDIITLMTIPNSQSITRWQWYVSTLSS